MLNPPHQVGTLSLARKWKSHWIPPRVIREKFPPNLCSKWTSQLSRPKGAENSAPAQRGLGWFLCLWQARCRVGQPRLYSASQDTCLTITPMSTEPAPSPQQKNVGVRGNPYLQKEAELISKLQSCRRRVAGKKHWPLLKVARSTHQLLQPPCLTLVEFVVDVTD